MVEEKAPDEQSDAWLPTASTREVVTLLLAVIVLVAGYGWLFYEGSRPVVPPVSRPTPVTTPIAP